MAIIYWPTASNFPQSPQKGFTESLGVNIIRSNMDAGPAKQRRRAARPSTMDLSFVLTTAQVDVLSDFIENSIRGVARFKFTHPRTGSLIDVRIVPGGDGDLYKLQYLAPGYYSASLKLEILP